MLPTMLTTSSLSGQNSNKNNKPSQTKKVQKPSLKKEKLDKDVMTKEAKDTLDKVGNTLDDKLDSIVPEDNDDSDSEGVTDCDALTTMNAIMEYNKKLMQKLIQLENMQKKHGKITKEHVQETVKDTYDEVKSKYDQTLPKNASFELPIGDILQSYGNFTTEELPDNEEEEDDDDVEHEELEEEDEAHHDEDTTVHDGEEPKTSSGSISLGNGDKDDIVVKVEATKTGITFCIHIPRN